MQAEAVYGVVPVSFLHSKPTRNEILVYTALASFQGKGEYCFPSLSALVKRSGLRTIWDVSRALSGLAKSGFVIRKQRARSANLYTLPKQIGPYAALPVSFLQSKPGKNIILVYAALSSFQGTESCCYPSRMQIGQRSGIRSLACVSRSIGDLQRRGWLRIKRQGQKANLYTLQNKHIGTSHLTEKEHIGASHLTEKEHIGASHLAEKEHIGASHLAEKEHIGTSHLAEKEHIEDGQMCLFPQVRGAHFPQGVNYKNPMKNPLGTHTYNNSTCTAVPKTQRLSLPVTFQPQAIHSSHFSTLGIQKIKTKKEEEKNMRLEKTKEEVLSELKVTLFPHADRISCWIYKQHIIGRVKGKLVFDLALNDFGLRAVRSSIETALALCQKYGHSVHVFSSAKKETRQAFVKKTVSRKIPNYPSYPSYRRQGRAG